MEYLDRLLEERAEETFGLYSGKRVQYKLESLGWTVDSKDDGKTGICTVRDVQYSPELDCDIYNLLDEKTGKSFSVCGFEVDLKIL